MGFPVPNATLITSFNSDTLFSTPKKIRIFSVSYVIYITRLFSMASLKFVGQVLFAIDALPGSD